MGSHSEQVDIAIETPDQMGELNVHRDRIKQDVDELKAESEANRPQVLARIVEELPEPNELQFILDLTYLIGATDDDYNLQKEALRWFKDAIESPPESIDRDPTFVRFAGFHALTIHSYSNELISEWGERHEKYRNYFTDWEYEAMYRFDKAMYDYHTNESDNIMRARDNLQFLANNELQDNTGVINAYVSCTLRACEKDLSVSDQDLQDAADAIRHAIRLFPFPEYFRNWGRLLGVYGERVGNLYILEKGKEKIRTGMERTESFDTRDLDSYRYYLNTIKYQERIIKADDEINDIRRRLQEVNKNANEAADEIRSETLQFIGFFSAIITFIVTTVQFSTSLDSVSQIASVIAIMSGCFVISFSVFIFLLKDESPINDKDTIGVVWGVGLFLIAAGLVFNVVL